MGNYTQYYVTVGIKPPEGSEEYNLGLSARRAKSVQNFFKGRGVKKSRLILDYLGEDSPLNTNSSEYEKALKNVLCLMILADKKVEEEEISTVSNIYNKLTNDKKFTKNQIDKNITQLKKDKKTVNQYLKKIKPYLNSGHRELIIKAMYYVASSDGHLDKKEGELLMKTANVLEMTPAHVKGVLAELDKKNNN